MTDHITPRGKSFFAAALAPETAAKLADDPHPPNDWPAFASALEIQRNEARAERDAARAELTTVNAERAEARGLRRDMIKAQDGLARVSAELADERAKKSDALIAAVNDIQRLTAENERLATGNHSMEKEIPQLRHAVERLTAERDEARNALTGNLWSEWETERAATLGRLAAAQQTVAQLRAALDEYGEHQGVCPKKYHGMKDARPCTCGLDAALATPAQ